MATYEQEQLKIGALHRIACALEEIRDELRERTKFKKKDLNKLWKKLDVWEKKVYGDQR